MEYYKYKYRKRGKTMEGIYMKKLVALVLVLVLCLTATSVLAEKYGTAILTSVGTANDATAEKDGAIQSNSTACFLVLNDDGTIKYVKFDVVQAKVTFDANGKCVTAVGDEIKSKEAKQYDYGMAKVSKLEKGEWFEQIAAWEAYCIGKTVEEVAATPLRTISEGHDTSPDVEELKSTCTMTVGEFIEALKAAAEVAK